MKPTDDSDTEPKKNIAYASQSAAFFSCIEGPREYLLSESTKPGLPWWLKFFPGISPATVATIYPPKENASPETTSDSKKKS